MHRPPAAAAVLACAAVIASCGGGDEDRDPPAEPPAELLATAVANPATSGDADIDLNVVLEGSSPLGGYHDGLGGGGVRARRGGRAAELRLHH